MVHSLLQRATVDLEGWPRQKEVQRLATRLSFALFRRVAKQLDMRRRVIDLLDQD